jgi:hypothetical protein
VQNRVIFNGKAWFAVFRAVPSLLRSRSCNFEPPHAPYSDTGLRLFKIVQFENQTLAVATVYCVYNAGIHLVGRLTHETHSYFGYICIRVNNILLLYDRLQPFDFTLNYACYY